MIKISEIEKDLENYLNEDNCYGIFHLDNLQEMSRAGVIANTKYEIHIEGGEGYTPHMHICKKSGKNIVLRINLLTNEYFREKDDINNQLSASERKALDSYLNDYFSAEFEITNWQHACMIWNQYNPAHEIKNIKNLTKPDYTTILEPH